MGTNRLEQSPLFSPKGDFFTATGTPQTRKLLYRHLHSGRHPFASWPESSAWWWQPITVCFLGDYSMGQLCQQPARGLSITLDTVHGPHLARRGRWSSVTCNAAQCLWAYESLCCHPRRFTWRTTRSRHCSALESIFRQCFIFFQNVVVMITLSLRSPFSWIQSTERSQASQGRCDKGRWLIFKTFKTCTVNGRGKCSAWSSGVCAKVNRRWSVPAWSRWERLTHLPQPSPWGGASWKRLLGLCYTSEGAINAAAVLWWPTCFWKHNLPAPIGIFL